MINQIIKTSGISSKRNNAEIKLKKKEKNSEPYQPTSSLSNCKQLICTLSNRLSSKLGAAEMILVL